MLWKLKKNNFVVVFQALNFRYQHYISIRSDRDVVLIPEIQSLEDYNKIVFFELPKHLKTSHALMIQYDGYVLSGDRFSENFLSYDYIGAPWPRSTDVII